ncbi:Rieske (2Fe-2S) protein [Streptomyces sp. enrichment culture]|uniref:Rieske (2Fe-2S) protein n=1 Tax=Streptomyces sp. enrichment culture TaxID=1795815 RepID=UPI003F5747B8
MDDVPILIVRETGGTIHALAERCSHLAGPLSEGKGSDGCVQCPWHGSVFRLSDGWNVRGPATNCSPRLRGWSRAHRRPADQRLLLRVPAGMVPPERIPSTTRSTASRAGTAWLGSGWPALGPGTCTTATHPGFPRRRSQVAGRGGRGSGRRVCGWCHRVIRLAGWASLGDRAHDVWAGWLPRPALSPRSAGHLLHTSEGPLVP